MPLAASAAKKESLGDVQAAAADSSAWQSQLRREGRVHQTLSTLWLPRLPNEGRPPDSVRTEPRFWLSAIRRKRLSRRRARPSGPATRQGSQIQSGLLVHSPQLLQRCLGPSFFLFLCQDNSVHRPANVATHRTFRQPY